MENPRITAIAHARFAVKNPDTSGMSEQEIEDAVAEEIPEAELFDAAYQAFVNTPEQLSEEIHLVGRTREIEMYKPLSQEEELELSKLAENTLDPSQNTRTQ